MKAPAFQFYAAEFLADENVVLMSNQAIGCYIKLICYCWREGSIPSDIEKLARLCSESSLAMAELWLSISPAFSAATNEPSRMIHPRLEKERIKQEQHSIERAESGRKGGLAKKNNALLNPSSASSSAKAEHVAKRSSSSSSSTSSINKQEVREPSAEHRELAQSLGVDCDVEFLKYRDHFAATGKQHKDQAAGFRNWLRRSAEMKPKPIKAGVSYGRFAERRETLAGLTGRAAVNEND